MYVLKLSTPILRSASATLWNSQERFSGRITPTDRKNQHKFFNIAISDTVADCQSPQVKLIYNEKDIVWMKIPLALGLFIG